MRQTSKRARRSRALMIVIFVLLAALVIWGLTALLGRLLHYGTNATVSAKDHEQLTPIEPSAGLKKVPPAATFRSALTTSPPAFSFST